MIHAAFLTDGDGHCKAYTIKGHAGFAPSGRDIVCAGVSLFATGCTNALETVAKIRTDVHAKDGDLSVKLLEDSPEAQVIVKVLRQGLDDIREQYPRYISIDDSKYMEE